MKFATLLTLTSITLASALVSSASASAFTSASASASVPGQNETPPVKVPAQFNKIYFPEGFDSNDHVQIVGEGLFRNTCYRPATESVVIDETTKTIRVGPVAYEYSGFCMQVILPFQRVVDVGILKVGHWKVIETDGQNQRLLGVVPVQPALSLAPDEDVYAPVSQAYFEQKGSVSEVTLSGNFPNNCMSLDDIKVSVQKEALVIQPFAKYGPDLKCVTGAYPFKKTLTVSGLSTGRYLLHVRSMNGNAINSLVDVR